MRMSWQEYESAVLEHLRQDFAGLTVHVRGKEQGQQHRVKGRYSGVDRQLDAAVYRQPTDPRPVLVADAKRYAGRVDVKDVEAFGGMAEDVGAQLCMLVAPEGFTAAAERRADAYDMELRIVTVDDALTHSWLAAAREIFPLD